METLPSLWSSYVLSEGDWVSAVFAGNLQDEDSAGLTDLLVGCERNGDLDTVYPSLQDASGVALDEKLVTRQVADIPLQAEVWAIPRQSEILAAPDDERYIQGVSLLQILVGLRACLGLGSPHEVLPFAVDVSPKTSVMRNCAGRVLDLEVYPLQPVFACFVRGIGDCDPYRRALQKAADWLPYKLD